MYFHYKLGFYVQFCITNELLVYYHLEHGFGKGTDYHGHSHEITCSRLHTSIQFIIFSLNYDRITKKPNKPHSIRHKIFIGLFLVFVTQKLLPLWQGW